MILAKFEMAVQSTLKLFPPDHLHPLDSARLFAFSLVFPEALTDRDSVLRGVLRKDRLAVAQCMRSVPQESLYSRIHLMNEITIECMTTENGDADMYLHASPAEIAGSAFFQTKQQWPQVVQQMACLLS